MNLITINFQQAIPDNMCS